MRDFAYQNPVLVLFIGFGLGMWLRPFMEWRDLWLFFVGFLLAHLFWGTKWRKGQGSNINTQTATAAPQAKI